LPGDIIFCSGLGLWKPLLEELPILYFGDLGENCVLKVCSGVFGEPRGSQDVNWSFSFGEEVLFMFLFGDDVGILVLFKTLVTGLVVIDFLTSFFGK
jgi:hypothetical protein